MVEDTEFSTKYRQLPSSSVFRASLGGNLASKIDFVTLNLFVTIIQEGSIAKAADRESIAPSAASKRVCDLENVLRVQLLKRHRRGVLPTSAGYALSIHARTILSHLKQLEKSLSEYSADSVEVRGHLNARANESAFSGFFPNTLSRFLHEYPKITIDLQPDTSTGVVQAVRDNAADIGIFWGDQPLEGLRIIPCYADRLVVVMPEDHPLSVNELVSFEELLECEFIEQESFSSIQKITDETATRLGRSLKTRIRVAGFDAVCRMVGAGLGIGIVPENFVTARAQMLGITKVLLDEPWASRVHKICLRANEEISTVTRLFVTHMSLKCLE